MSPSFLENIYFLGSRNKSRSFVIQLGKNLLVSDVYSVLQIVHLCAAKYWVDSVSLYATKLLFGLFEVLNGGNLKGSKTRQ